MEPTMGHSTLRRRPALSSLEAKSLASRPECSGSIRFVSLMIKSFATKNPRKGDILSAKWSQRWDTNPRPRPYQGRALPTELRRQNERKEESLKQKVCIFFFLLVFFFILSAI